MELIEPTINNINMEKTEKTNRSFEYSFSLHFHLGIFIVP